MYYSFRQVTEVGYISFPTRKVANRLPKLPCCRLGYRRERDGLRDNRHLNNLVKSIPVNVGGFYQDDKVSSPPRTDRSVGAVIVVGGWESQPQGEGRQRVSSCKLTSSNSAVNVPCERKGRLRKKCNDNFRGNPEGGMSTLGEPDALKGASPVRRRG
jgi:hypothetical protein